MPASGRCSAPESSSRARGPDRLPCRRSIRRRRWPTGRQAQALRSGGDRADTPGPRPASLCPRRRHPPLIQGRPTRPRASPPAGRRSGSHHPRTTSPPARRSAGGLPRAPHRARELDDDLAVEAAAVAGGGDLQAREQRVRHPSTVMVATFSSLAAGAGDASGTDAGRSPGTAADGAAAPESCAGRAPPAAAPARCPAGRPRRRARAARPAHRRGRAPVARLRSPTRPGARARRRAPPRPTPRAPAPAAPRARRRRSRSPPAPAGSSRG